MTDNETPKSQKPGFRRSKFDGVTPKFELPDAALKGAFDKRDAERAAYDEAMDPAWTKLAEQQAAERALRETVSVAPVNEPEVEETDTNERVMTWAEVKAEIDQHNFDNMEHNLLTSQDQPNIPTDMARIRKYAEDHNIRIRG